MLSKSVRVRIVPQLQDNYAYVVQCLATRAMACVDVSEPPAVLAAMQEWKAEDAAAGGKPLTAGDFSVLTTHKHRDHSGGNPAMAKAFGDSLVIRGGAIDKVAACTHPVSDGDEFALGALKVKVLHTPCHTKGHVLFHVSHPDDSDNGAVFTGDTVFVGGIGAFFEGDANDMIAALRRFSSEIPAATKVFPGHEYTMNFLGFANSLEADAAANPVLAQRTDYFASERAAGRPAVPSTVGDELAINPFVRAAVGGSAAAALHRALGVPEGNENRTALMQAVYDKCP